MMYITIELIHNASLLLALSIIHELSYFIPSRWNRCVPIIKGCLIGLIGIAVMAMSFNLRPGITFDTRSILVSVTALTFGTVPTLIAAAITIAYRIIQGGMGMYSGIAVITICSAFGLVWRHLVMKRSPRNRWLNVAAFGVITHILMLACMFLLPKPMILPVLQSIALPVMLIYPVSTVLLSMLLLQQKDRRDANDRTKEAEERYRSLFNNNHAVMLLVDPADGRLINANPAAVKFYGWTLETMKTMFITQINTLSQDKVREDMRKSASEEQSLFLFRHRKADGQVVDVEVHSGPIMQNGKTLIYSIVHDISRRVAADRALLESENRFRLLVECAPDAIFIQANEKFSFLNKAALTLFGAESADQLLGTSIMDRHHPSYHDIVRQRIHFQLEMKKGVPPCEEIFIKLDGTPVDVDVKAVPINYHDEDSIMVFVRDITERKHFQHEKQKVEAQLRQQQKLEAIGTLAGGVAHEINNPVHGIMNYAQLILDRMDPDTEEAEYTREIIAESNRVSAIVRNLLQFSRQEKQSHSYASIYDIINQTISLIKTIIKKDQIQLELHVDDNLPEIKCRSQQVQQVLMNLLTNARDALNEKYPDYHEDKIIHLYCSQYLADERRWIRITVEDHGNGIPQDVRERIFEPFFSTKPKEKGTGLGLAISFGIVKDHHGALNIETELGAYTRIHLDMPVDNGWLLDPSSKEEPVS